MAYGTTSTGNLTASTNAIISNPGGYILIHGIILTPAAALSTLSVFDAATQTGTAKFTLQAAASGSSTVLTFNNPVVMNTGVSATLAGASAAFQIVYSRG